MSAFDGLRKAYDFTVIVSMYRVSKVGCSKEGTIYFWCLPILFW